MRWKPKSQKTLRLTTVILLLAIALSPIAATAPVSPNLALDDFPATANYTIKTDTTNYWAVNASGYISSNSTSFPTVFNAVLTLSGTPAKGKIHLGLGTFQMAGSEFTISGNGEPVDIDAMRQLIIEGDGKDTIINQASQGKRIFIFNNRASFVLRDLTLVMRANNDALSESALYLARTGATSLTSSYGSVIDNVWIRGGDNTHPLMRLENFFHLNVGFLWVYSTYGNAIRIYNNNSADSYGNSNFDQVYAHGAGTSGIAMDIEGNTAHAGRQMNMLTFQHLEVGYGGNKGLYMHGHTKFVHIDFLSVEGMGSGDTNVLLGDGAGDVQGITIDYITGGAPTSGYFLDMYYASSVKINSGNVWAEGGATGYVYIRDRENYGLANDITMNIGEGGDIQDATKFSITSDTKPHLLLRGMNGAGSVDYQTHQYYNVSLADGATVTHYIGQKPNFVVVQTTVAGEWASVTAVTATTFTVAIKNDNGTAGTTQYILGEAAWYP